MKRRHGWLALLGLGFGLGAYRGLRRFERQPARRYPGESRAAFNYRVTRDIIRRVPEDTATAWDSDWMRGERAA